MSIEILQILDIIKHLSHSEKLEIIELISKDIKEENTLAEDETAQRKAAAELLLKDYQQDEELVAFTAIDHEAFMKRTEIWLINLDPTVGAEIKKIRPAIIVSDDALGILPLKVIVPITDWKSHYSTADW